MIEFDVETTGLQAYSGEDEAFYWIFSSEPNGADAEAIEFWPSEWHAAIASEEQHEAHARIQWWLDRAIADDEGIRAWNAKFDRAFLVQSGCFERVPGDGKWHDGMVVAHAINEDRSVALKAVAAQLFGEEARDPQKLLKEWLNNENKRRRSVVDRAGKIDTEIEKARIRLEKGQEALQKARQPHTKDRAQERIDEARRDLAGLEWSKPDLLAEAASYYREDGTFVYANYSDVPRDILEPYALEDVILTRKISDVYAPRLAQAPDLQRVVDFERKAMDALFWIENRGLPAREVEYRKLEMEVVDNLGPLQERVMDLVMEADPVKYAKELAGKKWGPGGQFIEVSEDGVITSYKGGAHRLEDFNPSSSAQVLAALKARGADLSFMSEKDGTVSADAENLQTVDDELAVAILNFRSENKVLTTYVRPMIGRSYVSAMNVYKSPFVAPDSRIHANYRQVGARTGRMSCSDPNMQNQPRDDLRLRYNIVADPEHVFVTCDLTNIEMYLFAAYCGEGRLLTAVQKGEDLHTLTAKMLGMRDRRRPGGGIETARQLGKTYNFSRVYGGGLRTIRRQFRCSMDDARLYKKRFDDAYPEVVRLQNRISYALDDRGYIQDNIISGRRFRVDPKMAYKATNYLVQGTAAALLKDAVIKLHADGVPMVALVHDEVVAHVHKSEAKEAALLIEKRMVSASDPGGPLWLGDLGKPLIPLKAEADIVKRWSDAKQLKDDDGTPYLFTPQWAGGEKRPVPSVDEVLAAA